jgi:hypothetical protein
MELLMIILMEIRSVHAAHLKRILQILYIKKFISHKLKNELDLKLGVTRILII